jgi:hypothetical protein
MAQILGPNGVPIPYTCENSKYRTNLAKGNPRTGYATTLGNVFEGPLADHGYSLWLEHAIEKKTGDEVYWLMWYDLNGVPTIPLSGVLNKADLEQMIGRLARFVP